MGLLPKLATCLLCLALGWTTANLGLCAPLYRTQSTLFSLESMNSLVYRIMVIEPTTTYYYCISKLLVLLVVLFVAVAIRICCRDDEMNTDLPIQRAPTRWSCHSLFVVRRQSIEACDIFCAQPSKAVHVIRRQQVDNDMKREATSCFRCLVRKVLSCIRMTTTNTIDKAA